MAEKMSILDFRYGEIFTMLTPHCVGDAACVFFVDDELGPLECINLLSTIYQCSGPSNLLSRT